MNNKIKYITIIITGICVVTLLVLKAMQSGNTEIELRTLALSGIKNNIAIEAGSEIEYVYITFPPELDTNKIVTVTSDEDVAYILVDRNGNGAENAMSAKVIGVSEGIAEVYARTVDGELMSEKYMINVIASDSSAVIGTTDASGEVADENSVYITPNGTKYHLRKSCAGENAIPTTLESAVGDGYEPCKICSMS